MTVRVSSCVLSRNPSIITTDFLNRPSVRGPSVEDAVHGNVAPLLAYTPTCRQTRQPGTCRSWFDQSKCLGPTFPRRSCRCSQGFGGSLGFSWNRKSICDGQLFSGKSANRGQSLQAFSLFGFHINEQPRTFSRSISSDVLFEPVLLWGARSLHAV
jgi:hypothetical protein